MNGPPRTESAELPLPLARQVEVAYQRFEAAWRAGQRPAIEDHLGGLPGPARAVLLPELLELELSCRRRAGEIDGHQRFVEGSGYQISGTRNPPGRIAAQRGGDHTHDQEGDEDAAADRTQTRRCSQGGAIAAGERAGQA